MKTFPRIHSLSALGLIHHQEFDYPFHPLRTDFIGDSGSGKSMIADLLQLIFVGSEFYKSATNSNKERTIEGMILKTPYKGTDIGYAVLNIEMQENQYVAIGVYLESTGNHAQYFIVQSGYSFEDDSELEFFATPLTCKDFIQEGQILPIDQIKEELGKRSLICGSWQRPKTYHSILFKNQILPLDLASSDKLLKDYAQILQSFSRGKLLNTQESDSLKEFLFGGEKGKEIFGKYKSAVQELQSAFSDYGRNLKEIELITKKQKDISVLKKQKEKRDSEKQIWITAEVVYWTKQEQETSGKLQELIQNHISSQAYLNAFIKIGKTELKSASDKIKEFDFEEKEKEKIFQENSGSYLKLQKVESWLKEYKCDEKELKLKYKTERQKFKHQTFLKSLEQILREKNLLDAFKQSAWVEGFQTGNKSYQDNCADYKLQIQNKEALLAFSDINNPDSLSYWAFHLKRALTIEEESTVVHFHELSKKKPEEKKSKRYLPKPEELFSALPISDKSKNGYWLNLHGIREFIPFVEKQILNDSDPEVTKVHFENFSSSIKSDLAQFKKQFEQSEQLYETLTKMENVSECIKAYQDKNELAKFQVAPSLNISEEEFTAHIKCLQNADKIREKYTKSKKLYESAQDLKRHNNEYIRSLERELGEVDTIFSPSNPAFGIKEVLEYFPELFISKHEEGQLVLEIKSILNSNDKPLAIRKFITEKKDRITSKELLKESGNSYQKAREEKEKMRLLYEQFSAEPIKIENFGEQYINKPEEEHEQHRNSQSIYITNYNQIIQQYLTSDAHKFENTDDFIGLSRNILPEAFLNENVTEETVIESIEHYLKSINDKNQQLNNRKIQKIKNLVEEVSDSVSACLDNVRKIDNFFKARDKQITGGYNVRLERDWAVNYPPKWIDKFKQLLEDEVGLFSNVDSLVNRLANSVTLEEKMKEAFHACGGSISVNPTVQKLLDPNSYFDLRFNMKAADGRINKGSTGQTYAAIALLCIARLSIIGKEEGGAVLPGVRFMPIDEAEGLGSNYDMLYEIAKNNDYQIVSLSVNPVGRFNEGEQFIYMLHKNPDEEDPVNLTPMGIFSATDIQKEAQTLIDI